MQACNVFWFRRDLRLNDNAALYHALRSGKPVLPIFVFDVNILSKLDDKADRRVSFIHAALVSIQEQLLQLGSSLYVFHGTPEDSFIQLLAKYKIETVFTNHDYEPYAIERDENIAALLRSNNTNFKTYKDQVIFEKDEVLKDNGAPYTVFTPYSRKWKSKINDFYLQSFPCKKYYPAFFKMQAINIPGLDEIGFLKTSEVFPGKEFDRELIKKYSETRDIPGIKGTSRIGAHLRFGTVSIRQLATIAKDVSEIFLNELIWRDFYQAILWHFPQVGKGRCFKPAYENIDWRNDEDEFHKWCEGQTGYPIVDAGMRELNETGFMHNRVRMVTASFLCKHLLIDWRWGEAYFAQKLLDYDLASNNGGWQWASGSGCDAAPYFRIFNPYLQTKKFDPQFNYIKKWVPEFQEFTYPKPIVDHEFARKRCLEAYSKALSKQNIKAHP
ncbi:MAG: deoxyribodipyrimidine photo-lyase [Ferruginibacter sp.]